MASSIRAIDQNLINMPFPRIQVQTVLETEVTEELLNDLLGQSQTTPRTVGLAVGYITTRNGPTLAVLAIAVHARVLLLRFRSAAIRTNTQMKSKQKPEVVAAREIIQSKLLANGDNILYAFDLAAVAASLYLYTDLRVENAVDIQDGCKCKDNRVPVKAVEFALNMTGYRPNLGNITKLFDSDEWDEAKFVTTTSVALKAWLGSFLPTISEMEEILREVKRVDLTAAAWPDDVSPITPCVLLQSPTDFRHDHDQNLMHVMEWAALDRMLDAKKAASTAHDFSHVNASQDKYTARGERFQNRLRASSNVRICFMVRS